MSAATFTLTADLAGRLARLALANVAREYPSQPGHVQAGAQDLVPTRALHPAFYGSYDWHSCVHMHWLLARVRRAFPALAERAAIEAMLDRHLAPGSIAGECAYFARPGTQAFERTYGWAWLLQLAAELAAAGDEDAAARRWSAALAPLTEAIVARYRAWLPKAHYPIRYGIHPNTAFGLALALDYARAAGALELEDACVAKAEAWYLGDRDAPAAWEPSGADFLSPSLMEADLVRRVLPPHEFAPWLAEFLPGIGRRAPATLFAPAQVADRSDPQIVHLDGLNLSRAWCLRGIAAGLPAADARVPVLQAAAAAHLAAGLAGLGSGDYVGAHWLASFAVLALT